MICVTFFGSRGKTLMGFSIKGHAETGEPGHDLLCAAVSSAAYMAVNTATDIIGAKARMLIGRGRMSVRLSRSDAGACHDIFSGFALHISGLESQYPKNIQVSYTEVQGNA